MKNKCVHSDVCIDHGLIDNYCFESDCNFFRPDNLDDCLRTLALINLVEKGVKCDIYKEKYDVNFLIRFAKSNPTAEEWDHGN